MIIKKKKKRLLLATSLLFGFLFNLSLLYFEHIWGNFQLFSLVVLEVSALSYAVAVMVSLVDLCFWEHRNMRIVMLNTFLVVLTLSVFWMRTHVFKRDRIVNIILQQPSEAWVMPQISEP
ncbi:MAG: hypothetical protein HC880_08265 [Bacteroidia bacterium]|nr:hypothetical protein [Bacteroidia bacterium]